MCVLIIRLSVPVCARLTAQHHYMKSGSINIAVGQCIPNYLTNDNHHFSIFAIIKIVTEHVAWGMDKEL